MNIVGKVIKILDARTGVSQRTGNEWYIREFVIETEEQYPTKLCIQVSGKDKWEQWNVQVGNKYDVSFNISSREWNEKWFTSIDAWKIVSMDSDNNNNSTNNPNNNNAKSGKAQNTTKEEPKQEQPKESNNEGQANNDDDLPF